MFDRDLDATELMFDRDMEGGRMTMEDGTPIEGVFNTYRSGSHLCSYVSLMKTTDVQFPGGLINQVCLGNVKELRRLLEDGVDVNARTWEGDKGTALGMALLHSNDCTETLKCLVSRPDIDAEDTDSDDNTLLHRTIGQVPEARLSAFMCRPVDTHATNKLGRNLLHELMRTHVTGTGGGLKMMALLGQGSGTLLLGVDSSGQLPLDLVSGDSRTLRIFADKGIPIKEATIWELTTVILSFVPVSALTMLILGYYTVL
jgi:ankyrin repeat protein